MGLCNFLDVPSHFGMKYDRPWNMVKKLLELFNAQSKLKKIRCYAENVTKWQEMIFFCNNTADRFAIYLMDLTQTVLNNADEYNDETSKKLA